MIILLLPGLKLFGQINATLPSYTDQFYNNHPLITPAYTDTINKTTFRAGDKSQTGLFKGVNKIYFDADFNNRNRSLRNYSNYGLTVLNNRIGEFINASRVYGRYSRTINLTEKAQLTAGIAFGLISLKFSPSQVSPGGTGLSPDGSIGLSYGRDKFCIGTSVQQMFNNGITPVNQKFIFNRYLNIYGYKHFQLTYNLLLTLHALAQLQQNNTILNGAAVLGHGEHLQFSIGGRNTKAIVFSAGVQQLDAGFGLLSTVLSYQVTTGKIAITDNAFELLFRISFRD